MPRWGFTVPLSSMGACRDRAEKDDDPTCTPCARYNKMSAINVLALCGMRLIDRRLDSFADDNTPSWHWMSGIAALFHGSSCHVFSLFLYLSFSLSLFSSLFIYLFLTRDHEIPWRGIPRIKLSTVSRKFHRSHGFGSGVFN